MTSIEYALIGALIAMVIVVAVTATGANLATLYNAIAAEVVKAAAPAAN